jgi:glycosyltransferase involved in cell wall biosynthesis
MTSKPNVGIPAGLWRTKRQTGDGRVWHSVLPELRRVAKLRTVELDDEQRPPFSRRLLFKPDLWLASGHSHPPRVAQPLIAVVHEAGWVNPEIVSAPPEFLAVIRAATDEAIAAADQVIVPSESSRAQVLSGYDISPDRVTVVPYGVDSTAYRPGLRGGRAMVASARGGPLRPYVLFASVPYERKNLAALRTAMANLARHGFPHLLVIAGGALDGPGSAEAMRKIEADLPDTPGRVVWLKELSDPRVAALMAEADAFCLPSFSEGFGLTVLEAMACGTPVVVSNGGSLPEVVGDAGIVVEPTAAAVEGALATLLADPAAAHDRGRAARARAERFTWARTAGGWAGVLRRVTDARRWSRRGRSPST